MNNYVKWLVVVTLNAVVGFFLGGFSHTHHSTLHFVGMIAGVITWYFFYVSLDLYLLKTGRNNASRKLFLSAHLRIYLQFLFLPDMYAGLAAIMTVDFIGLGGLGNSFISSYSCTIFTGLYLSVFCSVIYLMVTGFDMRYNNK